MEDYQLLQLMSTAKSKILTNFFSLEFVGKKLLNN
jgi:hypothetical protein